MFAQAWQFVMDHPVVFSSLAVAILDAAFAFSPSVNANGLLHWVYDRLVGIKKV